MRVASLESGQISPNEGMVGIVDDDSDISMLFADALRGVDGGISVFTFNDSLEPGELQNDIKKGIIDGIILKPISINSLRQEVKNQINSCQLRINKK